MRKAETGFGSLVAPSAGAARGLIRPENASRPRAFAEPDAIVWSLGRGVAGGQGWREPCGEMVVQCLTTGSRPGGGWRRCPAFSQGCLLWPE